MPTKKEVTLEVLNIFFDQEKGLNTEDSVEMMDCIAVVMAKLMSVEDYVDWLNDRKDFLMMVGVSDVKLSEDTEKPKPNLTLVK